MTEYEKERERIRARRDDWEERHGGGGGGGISIIETLTDKDGPLWLQILVKVPILAFGWFLWNIGFLAVYCNFLGIFDFVREFCDSGSTSVRVIIYICLAALQTFIIRFTNIDGELIVWKIPVAILVVPLIVAFIIKLIIGLF